MIEFMDELNDFMLFNACEDAREEQESHTTTEYPYQSQFWEEKEEKSSFWDNDDSSSSDDY